ncbi:MAG: phospholipase D-like domain-containing protein [Candidatus Methanoplasma sp.]|jgi:phosphatidylserine/phosphatidylglycerophosphate/cardiolipin synthase-like enzyme|nr:phospholipase D-like domain-containing protein [Candidatus Methanoplasma sp.]
MTGRKRYVAAVVLALFFLSSIPTAVTSEAAGDGLVLISEVNPAGDYEGISLFNYGISAVNLKGYIITDGEGELQFNSNLTISPSARVTLSKAISPDDWFSSRDGVYSISDTKVITQTKKNYALADDGDDVYLYKDGNLLDAVCYGSKTASPGWTGEPLAKVTKASGKYLLRAGVVDSDTAKDWIVTSIGLTNRPFSPSLTFDAVVTPFVFPDSKGEQIYRTLENARSEILISIYQLTNVNLVALLCDLESRTGPDHVDVKITLEGAVLGADLSTELTLMRSLVDAGGEVWLINDSKTGNYERFSYFHNKYAVVDEEIVIITSENWTQGNLSSGTGNRGWGAIIESTDYAAYMKEIFNNDHDKGYGDVWDLVEYYPGVTPRGDLTYKAPSVQEVQSFTAKITPILSPDNSYAALKYYMESATDRIYSEQLDLGSTFSNVDPSSPVSWMSAAANRGVDARFILDASLPSRDEHITEVSLINSTTGVKASTIKGGTGFSTTHNKGIIIDDKVWVGSVNWTSNSFQNNRETAILIDSKDVTDFFLAYFLLDWGNNKPAATEMTVTVSPGTITSADDVAFTVHGGPSDAKYEWDIFNDGNWVQSGTGTIVRSDLPAGSYKVKVRTTDGSYFAESGYIVTLAEEKEKEKDNIDLDDSDTKLGIMALVILFIICIALGGVKLSKRRGGH